MRMLKPAALGLALALSGCIDVEMDSAILGPDQARLTGFIEVNRAMFDMMGGAEEFCPADEGGTLEMRDETARCNILMEGSFDEVFTENEDGSPGPVATDRGDGTVHVTFPLGDLTGDMEEMRSDPAMAAMFRPMLEGHSISLSISGVQIVSSNGTISDDGTRATISFALTDILDDTADIPEDFEAVVRY